MDIYIDVRMRTNPCHDLVVTKFYFRQTGKSKTKQLNRVAVEQDRCADGERAETKLPTTFHPVWCLLHAFKGELKQRRKLD